MTRRLADWLLVLARHIAPHDRRPWVEALRAEAASMPSGPLLLRWAGGGVVASAGWAVRKEWLYLFLILVLAEAHIWITGVVMDLIMARGADFITAAVWSQRLVPITIAGLLAAWRPHRALVTALVLPVLLWTLPLRVLLEGFEFRWGFELMTTFTLCWPFVLGAGLGAVAGGRRRILS